MSRPQKKAFRQKVKQEAKQGRQQTKALQSEKYIASLFQKEPDPKEKSKSIKPYIPALVLLGFGMLTILFSQLFVDSSGFLNNAAIFSFFGFIFIIIAFFAFVFVSVKQKKVARRQE